MWGTFKPIETLYNGYRFRSRLEARAAVLYDALKIRYLYEPEGFELGGGLKYLPDFWLKGLNCYVEIKPGDSVDAKSQQKARLLAERSGQAVFVFFGDIGIPTPTRDWPWFEDGWRAMGFGPIIARTYDLVTPERAAFIWVECLVCDAIGIVSVVRAGKTEYPICACRPPKIRHNGPKLTEAYTAARSARFEFGEDGTSPPRIKIGDAPRPRFTPAKAPVTLDYSELRQRWPALRSLIWTTPIDRATFHSARLVGLEGGNRLVIEVSRAILLLLKDEQKRAVRARIGNLLGAGADVRFIDAAPAPPPSKWDGLGVGHTIARAHWETDGDGE